MAVVPSVTVITYYTCLLEQLQYRQVNQNLSFLFLVQISLRKAVLEISVGKKISGSGGLGDPSEPCSPRSSTHRADRLSHWASVDLGFSPGFTLPAEKAVAPHSSTLGWKLPWVEEPGRLQSVGS